MSLRLDLLSNATATGAATPYPGGFGSFFAAGTFSGSTVTLQVLMPDGTTYVAVSADCTVTAAGGGNFYLPPCTIRALVAGGPPSGMYATVVRALP
jgi:hypothetical protein